MRGLFGEMAKVSGRPRRRSLGKLGNVVGKHPAIILRRLLLGKQKGFGEGACLGVEMRNIRPGVGTVIASGGEDHPSPIGGETMVAFCVWRIDFTQRAECSLFEVEKPQIGPFVPNMKDTLWAEGENEPTPVGGDSGKRDGTTVFRGVDDHPRLAESSPLWIKVTGNEVIAEIRVSHDSLAGTRFLVLWNGGESRFCGNGIERFSIRRP